MDGEGDACASDDDEEEAQHITRRGRQESEAAGQQRRVPRWRERTEADVDMDEEAELRRLEGRGAV